MDLGSETPLQSILDASQKCLDLFRSCLLGNPNAVAELEAAERLFRAWTNNVNVFSQSASLDTQLREEKYGQIRQMVVLLLNVLNEHLSLVLRLISSDQQKCFLEIPLFGINESLKRLDRAAAVILQGSQSSLIKRTIVFAEKQDDFQRLSRTFSKVILSRYRGLRPEDQPENMPLEIADLIPTKEKVLAQRPEGLFLALMKTSIVRHFRILYERGRIDREKKLLAAPAMKASKSQGSNLADGDTIQRQYGPSQSDKLVPHGANQTAERENETRSENQPTALSIDMDSYITRIARLESASTSAHEKSVPPIAEASVVSYPRAPKIPYGQKEGICTICRQVFPAEELKNANWIVHATKDIKPYVCISKDCMSNIQFFERRRHWIDHMHRVHTPLWIRYLHNLLRWNCSLCDLDSAAVFVSEEEVKASFIEHLQQSHPCIEKMERQYLISNSVVPQPRSSESCPICGILHQPRDDENKKFSLEGSSLKPSNRRSTRATDDHRVENCIAEHLRELALIFSAHLIDDDDDDQQGPDVLSGQNSDGHQFEFKNLLDFYLRSDEQRNSHFDQIDDYGAIEPNISDEEWERLFPDNRISREGGDLWSRASNIEELEYREVKNITELPFEIHQQNITDGNPTILRVQAKSQNSGRQSVMKKFYLHLEPGESVDERTKRLCRKEVMAIWHARHQHVIEVAMAFIFESGETDDGEGTYFGIIMELAEQGNITEHLSCQRPAAEMERILTWFRCLANATAYIHSIGIKHRDIKPSNILIRGDGTVLLADFGVSKMGLGKTLSTILPEGPGADTLRYAAPEVGEGGARGRQADIFSLGAIFFEMLIAHSFEHLRPTLLKKIKSRKSRLGCALGQAYAASLLEMHDWINEIQGDLNCDEEHWHRTILNLCLKMTSEIREARPSAEEVYSIISGSESLKREASLNCNCEMASVQTESRRLIKACQRPNGYDEVASFLGNEDNLHIKGAIQQAASHGCLDTVQQFLDRGADVDQLDHCDQTALHCAAAYGHADITQLLLVHGAKIDIRDEEEQLPLHCASGQGQLKVVEILLEHDITGATLLSEDYYGQIPLHCAAKRGFTDVVRILIAKMDNNSVMKTDAGQRTALHLAARYGSEAGVRLLLDAVTDKGVINSLDENNMTALHWATIGRQRNGGYIKIMKMLMERGADVNIRGGSGHKTAINHARKYQDEERIAVLLNAEKRGPREPGAQLIADSAPDTNQMVDTLLQEIEHPGQYVDADVQKIKMKLLGFHSNWPQLARICMILLNMQIRKEALPDILRKFEDQSLADYHLPIREIDLRKVLSPSLCERFQFEQEKALIRIFQFEEREKHYNLETDYWNRYMYLENKGYLGGAGSSKVMKVSHEDAGDIYAVKLITRTGRDIAREVAEKLKLLKRVRHTHIVSFVESFTSPRYFGLLMVPVAEFNLEAYLTAACYDSEKRSKLPSFCGCLISALHHLHYVSHMTHKNIKPGNILIHNENVLFTDFGISLYWSESLRTTMFGPAARIPMYCAPEITNEIRLQDPSSDIWSLGCVFLEIISVFIGQKEDDIKQFLKDQNPINQTYNKNPRAIQQWIKKLEESVPALEWLALMLEENPSLRPNTFSLWKELSALSIAEKSYFGNCCRAERLTRVQVERSSAGQPERDDAEVPIEQHSKIAAVAWLGECRVYFQDIDGIVCEAICFDGGQEWQQRQPEDKIARAKRYSPLAATAWQEFAGHRQTRVHVYFINEENLLQERVWDPISNWTDGALNALKVEIAPSSQLSATSWGDGNIMLCYQGSDNSIHILDGWAHDAVWKRGTTLEQADSDSPLSVINFEHLGFRSARLYFKLDGLIREACWDEVRDDVRAPAKYYFGDCYFESPPNSSVSANVWSGELPEKYLYIASRDILHEWRYSGGGDWTYFDLSLEAEGRDGCITAVRWASETTRPCVFSIERSGLAEFTYDNGIWSKKCILMTVACVCPTHSLLSEPMPGSATSSSGESSIQLEPYQSPTMTMDASVRIADEDSELEVQHVFDERGSRSSAQEFKELFCIKCCALPRARGAYAS
ncbi:hypothetical protein H0G86_013158 [Trichoderma simmonsii]|uniref:Protein kinase domain-containing protein n=1 Tax=Trichoderma simmonsii TaxID=1491479 RepID=A0A8G0LSS2_9HYPO|nr:hypothetical protein H0G86_013158 [Trichoderma simmonsii]